MSNCLRTLVASLFVLATMVTGAPGASAHIELFSQAKSFQFGNYSVLIDPQPVPLFAESPLTMYALVYDFQTQTQRIDVNVTVRFHDDQPYSENLTLEPNQQERRLVKPFTVPAGYDYAADVTLWDANQTFSGNATFTVYPNLPYRIRPVDEELDVEANVTTNLEVEIFDPQTQQRVNVLDDLTVKAEHWTNDHGRILDSHEFKMTNRGEGVWGADHAFPDVGMWHLWFASESGNMEYYDAPMFHMYALEPREGGGDAARSPGIGPVLALVFVGLATLLISRRRA